MTQTSAPGGGDPQQPAYRIGAAARLTGVSTHTLRKWEDRYGLVAPRRSAGGERLYSAADVRLLVLVRELAQAGLPLAELAGRDADDLERLRRQTRAGAVPGTEGAEAAPVSVVVIGAALPTLIAHDRPGLRRVRVIEAGDDVPRVAEAIGAEAPDVLVMECPAVTRDSAEQVAGAMRTLGADAAVVVYGFGARADLDALRRRGVALVRAPADASDIERLCLGLVASRLESWPVIPVARPLADDVAVEPRRWDRDTLAKVAGMTTRINCECPRHLADLIMSLAAFEDYSAACESRDDDDRALHRFLQVTSATARALLEDALARVARAEALPLD